MRSIKRILTLMVAATLLLTCGTALTLPAAAKDVNLHSGTGSRNAEFVTGDVGYRAIINAPFTGFAFSIPTWETTTARCTLSMYKWAGTYRDTLRGEAIASQKFEGLRDNASNWVTFDEQPAGEYLFLITEPAGTMGIWFFTDPETPRGFSYKGGQECVGDIQMQIRFPKSVTDPFGVCEPSVDPIDGNHTPPAEPTIPEDSLILTHEVMPDTWVFTDGLGRVSLTNAEVGDPKDDKTVAMFYWTWHMHHKHAGAYNNDAFLRKYPEAIRDYDHPAWEEVSGCGLYWNEPLWGFYAEDDAWVVRRQGELLANAGVDAVLTDNTNGTFTWQSGYQAVLSAWSEARAEGVRTPKLSFMLPFAGGADTAKQLRDIYLDIFRTGDYHDLWFYWDGKPVVMAHGNSSGLDAKDNLDKEILNFFTFRPGYAGYTNSPVVQGRWGWLSIYPQPYYCSTREEVRYKTPEQVTVGVAMNHSYELDMIAPMNGFGIMGRSYTHYYENRYAVEGDEASKWGYNFAEQFEYAIEADPRLIFVTGWNEWTAGRSKSWPEGYASAMENAMPDQCNDEFSRDIEPTKGALKDHYYYQLVNYVRKFKGARPIPAPSLAATVDISKDNTQWNAVEPYFAAYIGNTDHRDAEGMGDLRYTEYSGRNDIIGAKVARDAENLYFYVECNADITPYTDALWMNLYIDADQENQGWESFDYVLNKTAPTADKAVLEKFTGNGFESEKVGEVDYTVDGKYMQVKIPKTMLGIEGFDFTVNFAWTDNVHDADDAAPADDTAYKYAKFSGDIMDFYLSGDAAPGGRFKFSYISTAENAGVESTDTEQPTEAPTDPVETPTEQPTDGETEAPTDAPATEAPTETPKKGCGSSVALGLVALVALMGTALLGKKER